MALISHAGELRQKLEANIERALTAMGVEGAGAVKEQMQYGYGKPIKQTGNLMGSISSGVVDDRTVAVGTNVEYATFVHEGTSKRRWHCLKHREMLYFGQA